LGSETELTKKSPELKGQLGDHSLISAMFALFYTLAYARILCIEKDLKLIEIWDYETEEDGMVDAASMCEINIDGRFTRGGFVLEMKKSDRRREASMLQLAFYVVYFWVMKDFYVIGKVKYLEDKCVDLVKPEDWIEKVLKATINIVKIAEKEVPPDTEVNKSICKKCAYFEFCWA